MEELLLLNDNLFQLRPNYSLWESSLIEISVCFSYIDILKFVSQYYHFKIFNEESC
jgi:hypothetical protein